MEKYKKIPKAVISVMLGLLITVFFSVNVYADSTARENSSNKPLGLVFDNDSSERTVSNNTGYRSLSSLPNSVDNSTSVCFPPIENQNDQNSCVAFATTYYQFSYEVNRLNNVTSASDRVIYSPKWTYNLLNKGSDRFGLRYSAAYRLLEDLGALKNDDYTYTGTILPSDYTNWPSTLNSQKIEALQTRITYQGDINIPTNANISSPNSSALNSVKTALNDGKVLTVGTNCYFVSGVINGESIIYRCMESSGENGGGHALTIVGYNDTIEYDVNGNGIIESCEKGAFRVANSWGTSFNSHGIVSNTGYFWIMYDALNANSTNTYNSWESNCPGTRRAVFIDSDNSYNEFHYINVDHIKVNLIGCLNVNVADKYQMFISKYRGTDVNLNSGMTWNGVYPYNGGMYMTVTPFTGTIFFDYSSLANPINNYYTGYNWWVRVTGIASTDTLKFAIFDNNSNIVKSYKTLQPTSGYSGKSTYQDVDFSKGDLNYDNVVNEDDVDIMLSFNLNTYVLSNYQYCLGDITGDGVVDLADLIAMSKITTSSSLKAYVERAVIKYHEVVDR